MIASVPSRPTARPRNNARVPIVTASDGRPTYAIRKPLKAPHSAPTRIASRPATGSGSPASAYRMPSMTLVSPITLATDRSISPVMMISVIGSAISMIGAMSRNR